MTQQRNTFYDEWWIKLYSLFFAADLFCDGEINCGFNDSDFGSDEQKCDGSVRHGSGGKDRPASLYVFAVTCIATLVLVILLMFLACCCVRKYGTRHQPPSHLGHLAPFQDHLEFHMGSSGYSLIPTISYSMIQNNAKLREFLPLRTPMSTLVTSEINEKKPEDCPPAYDDLFPHCSEPTTTKTNAKH